MNGLGENVVQGAVNPEEAFLFSMIPNDGVGLARMEFIINSCIKVHPMALIHPERIPDNSVRKEIDNLTFGYKNKEDYFAEKLAHGVSTIVAALLLWIFYRKGWFK